MSNNLKDTPEIRLGFTGLSALVFSMMVGAGIFNIPQNMAIAAGPKAVIVSWLITAAGMLLLVATFKILSDRHPELNAGMYLYARKGFGPFAGFMTAWGYWLCTAFANVAYAVMLNDTVGSLIPPLLAHGWPTLLFGSALIWIIYFIVVSGLRTAKIVNTVMSSVKIGCILLIIALLFIHMRLDTFLDSFAATAQADGLPGMASQIKDTMLVTLWCFIGIEGAVMMSGRARRNSDVGRARRDGILHRMAALCACLSVEFRSHGPGPSGRVARPFGGICTQGNLRTVGLLACDRICDHITRRGLGGMVARMRGSALHGRPHRSFPKNFPQAEPPPHPGFRSARVECHHGAVPDCGNVL